MVCINWSPRGKHGDLNYLSVRTCVADQVDVYPKHSITKPIHKRAVFGVLSISAADSVNTAQDRIVVLGGSYLKLLHQNYVAWIGGKLIQKLLLNQEVYELLGSCLLQYFSYNVLQRWFMLKIKGRRRNHQHWNFITLNVLVRKIIVSKYCMSPRGGRLLGTPFTWRHLQIYHSWHSYIRED